jgi:hypothetical protein
MFALEPDPTNDAGTGTAYALTLSASSAPIAATDARALLDLLFERRNTSPSI